MQPCLFHLLLVHFVFASLASVIIPGHDGLSAHHTSREVGSAFSAAGVILANHVFTITAWTLDLFAWSLFGWMLGEYAYCHVHVFFPFLGRTHSLQLYKGSGTLLITLNS